MATIPHKLGSSFRILVTPYEIAGYYSNLTRGFRLLGVDADFVTHSPSGFAYGGETITPRSVAWMRYLNLHRNRYRRFSPRRLFFSGLAEACRFAWFLTAILRYRCFIFGFGGSLLPWNIDLPILRLLGKRVVSNLAHGSDARAPFVNGFMLSLDGCAPSALETKTKAELVRRIVTRHQRFASVVIGAPLSTSYYASSRMVNLFAIGLPVSLPIRRDVSQPNRRSTAGPCSGAVRILHAPSRPIAKGSADIEAAISRLQARGHRIEFVTVTGRPVSEVYKELEECDFVVDQLYSDWPLAGFATEAAWFGKPAVVGGYGTQRAEHIAPAHWWPPSRTCHPDQVSNAIEELVVNPRFREQLGREAQSFVHKHWNAATVAKRYLQLLHGDIPDNWWFDPKDVVYVEGWGQSAELSRERIRDLVGLYGVQALQLSHRPDLERAFIEFAGLTKPE